MTFIKNKQIKKKNGVKSTFCKQLLEKLSDYLHSQEMFLRENFWLKPHNNY